MSPNIIPKKNGYVTTVSTAGFASENAPKSSLSSIASKKTAGGTEASKPQIGRAHV